MIEVAADFAARGVVVAPGRLVAEVVVEAAHLVRARALLEAFCSGRVVASGLGGPVAGASG